MLDFYFIFLDFNDFTCFFLGLDVFGWHCFLNLDPFDDSSKRCCLYVVVLLGDSIVHRFQVFPKRVTTHQLGSQRSRDLRLQTLGHLCLLRVLRLLRLLRRIRASCVGLIMFAP